MPEERTNSLIEERRAASKRLQSAANVNPVVMLIVRRLAAAAVTDNRIAFTNGASPQHGFGAARGPIGLDQLVR
jgi:hypothetical protein